MDEESDPVTLSEMADVDSGGGKPLRGICTLISAGRVTVHIVCSVVSIGISVDEWINL